MPPSETPGFTLHGLAKDDGTVYFVGDKPIYKNLIYHEFGHTLDFASYALIDWDKEIEDSWSTQDDWQAIYESEWRSEERRVGKGRRNRRAKRDWSSDVCSSDLWIYFIWFS